MRNAFLRFSIWLLLTTIFLSSSASGATVKGDLRGVGNGAINLQVNIQRLGTNMLSQGGSNVVVGPAINIIPTNGIFQTNLVSARFKITIGTYSSIIAVPGTDTTNWLNALVESGTETYAYTNANAFYKVAVTQNDTTPGFLFDKIMVNGGSMGVTNPAGNEKVTITVTGGGSSNAVAAGSNVTVATNVVAGVTVYTVSASLGGGTVTFTDVTNVVNATILVSNLVNQAQVISSFQSNAYPFLVFFGDSTGAWGGTPGEVNGWVFQIATNLFLGHQGILNLAKSSVTLSNAVANYGSTTNFVNNYRPFKTGITNQGIAVIELGLNDITQGQTFAQMTNDFGTFWSYLRADGLRICQGSVLFRTNWTAGQNLIWTNINSWLSTNASVDYFTNHFVTGTDDGTHPNAAGSSTIASNFVGVLAPVVSKKIMPGFRAQEIWLDGSDSSINAGGFSLRTTGSALFYRGQGTFFDAAGSFGNGIYAHQDGTKNLAIELFTQDVMTLNVGVITNLLPTVIESDNFALNIKPRTAANAYAAFMNSAGTIKGAVGYVVSGDKVIIGNTFGVMLQGNAANFNQMDFLMFSNFFSGDLYPTNLTGSGDFLAIDSSKRVVKTNLTATLSSYPTRSELAGSNYLRTVSETATTTGIDAAGNLAIRTNFYQPGGTDVAVSDGGTGLSSGTSGGVLAFTASGTIASSGALAANALVIGGGAGAAPSTTTTGAGILTFLGTPSSANLASAVTDETGSGALVFGTAPQLSTIELGNASDTTLSRSAAGLLAVEGNILVSRSELAGSNYSTSATAPGTNNVIFYTNGLVLNTVYTNMFVDSAGISIVVSLMSVTAVTDNAKVGLWVETGNGSGNFWRMAGADSGGAVISNQFSLYSLVPPFSRYYGSNESSGGTATAVMLTNILQRIQTSGSNQVASITNNQQQFGIMGNHGVITNESQALLTGNLMQGSNQVWSLTTTAATINMACSNLNEDTQYFLVTTNSVLTVFGTMTNVDYVQGWRAIPANSVTVITFYKKFGKTTAFINSGIATYPLIYADATNIVVDGSFAPNFSLNITNATVNLLITNFALAASIDITGWSNGFSAITTVNNAFRVLTNSTGLLLTTNGNALDVLTLKRSTNSTTAAAQVAKGFQ